MIMKLHECIFGKSKNNKQTKKENALMLLAPTQMMKINGTSYIKITSSKSK